MSDQDNRWKQRFANYRKANALLQNVVKLESPSDIERMGLIHAFEMTIKLGWKVLKDYPNEQGQIETTPKNVVRRAYQFNIIEDAEPWLEALDCRNRTSHTYDREDIIRTENEIKANYVGLFRQLASEMEARL